MGTGHDTNRPMAGGTDSILTFALHLSRSRQPLRFMWPASWTLPPFAFWWAPTGALLGLVVGSFVATLAIRWPRGEATSGRSHCDGCGRMLRAVELVPLLSFLWRRGRCGSCGHAIDRRHPLIEATAAGIGLLAFLAAPGWHGLAGALLGWALLALLALDCSDRWLPDRITLPLLALGLLVGVGDFQGRLLGALAGGGGLLAIALAYRAVRGHDGMGLGDVKLLAALGAWLGLWALPLLLLAATLLGLAIAGIRHLSGDPVHRHSELPFGACLAAAAFPLWLWAVATPTGAMLTIR